MKTLILALVLMSLSQALMAAPLVGGCSGIVNKTKIVFNGSMTNAPFVKTGKGSISVGGRVLAEFDGRDAKINFLNQSVKGANNHGDILEAQVTNMARKTGVLKKLIIRAYGINVNNVPIACWYK